MTQMASTTSFFQISIKEKLKNKRFWTILMITNLLSGPLFILNYFYFQAYSSIWISVLASLVIGASGLVIPLSFFDYLYQRTKIDDVLKLPLTRKQLFFSDYLSGLVLYLVPIVCQFLLSTLLLLLRNTSLMDTLLKNNIGRYDNFTNIFKVMVFAYLAILVALVFLYTTTVFVLSCVGNTFEAITASIYLNLLIPGVIFSVGYLLLNGLYGISLETLFQQLLYFTSAGGVLGYLFLHLNELYEASSLLPHLFILLPALLVTFTFLLLSYRNFIKRKAESVGIGFINRVFYYFILTSLTFLLAAFFYQLNINFITSLSLLAFIFLTFEVITNRGFQKFYRSILRFTLISAISIACILVVDATECFGIVYRTSEVSNIKSITIRYTGVMDLNGYQSQESIVITDPGNIETILNFHEVVLNDYNANKSSEIDNNTIKVISTPLVTQETNGTADTVVAEPTDYHYVYRPTFDIKLDFDVKAGIDYSRNYQVNFEQRMLLASIDLSDEYIDQLMKNNSNSDTVTVSDVFDFSSNRYPLGKDQVKDLFACLGRDMKKISLEEYLTPTEPTRYKINEIPILASYTETLQFMKDHHFSTVSTEAIYDYIKGNQDFSMIAPSMTMKENDLYYHGYYSDFSYDTPKYADSDFINNHKEDILSLLEGAQYHYATKEPCFRMNIGKYTFIIPAQYSDLATTLYQQLN